MSCRVSRVTVASFVVAVALGCGPKAPEDQRPLTKASESVTPASGSDFSSVDLPTISFQIPNDWFVADLTRGGLEQRLEEVAKTNPELKDSFLQIRQAADNKSFLLYAFKKNSSDQGFTDNFYIQQSPVQGNPTLKDVASLMEGQVQSIPGAKLASSRVETQAGHDWQRTEWSMGLAGDDKELKLRLFNYSTIFDGKLISLNFTAKEQSLAVVEGDASSILASVQLKRETKRKAASE